MGIVLISPGVLLKFTYWYTAVAANGPWKYRACTLHFFWPFSPAWLPNAYIAEPDRPLKSGVEYWIALFQPESPITPWSVV